MPCGFNGRGQSDASSCPGQICHGVGRRGRYVARSSAHLRSNALALGARSVEVEPCWVGTNKRCGENCGHIVQRLVREKTTLAQFPEIPDAPGALDRTIHGAFAAVVSANGEKPVATISVVEEPQIACGSARRLDEI